MEQFKKEGEASRLSSCVQTLKLLPQNNSKRHFDKKLSRVVCNWVLLTNHRMHKPNQRLGRCPVKGPKSVADIFSCTTHQVKGGHYIRQRIDNEGSTKREWWLKNLNVQDSAKRCYVEKVPECYQIFSRLTSKRKKLWIIKSFLQPSELT